MRTRLDLADIQGNVIRAYGRFGFPKARYFFLHIHNADAGKAFVNSLFPHVTTATRWKTGAMGGHYPGEDRIPIPETTLNIGFSYAGLVALGLPTRTLSQMPDEFIDGMSRRDHILGDKGTSGRKNWDKIWRNNHDKLRHQDNPKKVHIWISINALVDFRALAVGKFKMKGDLDKQTRWLQKQVDAAVILDNKGKSTGKPGVEILSGHGAENTLYQDASAIIKTIEGRETITPEEHFGYRDGIGDPVFNGQFPPAVEKSRVVGRGKITPDGEWQPLATGEFLLGHVDESQEVPTAALPPEISLNGTFMAYRKLQEDVEAFEKYTTEQARTYGKVMGMDDAEALPTLRAKMVGRWSDGTPLMAAPDLAAQKAFRAKFKVDLAAAKQAGDLDAVAKVQQRETDFKYADDVGGLKCPYSAHLRRGNARDMLDPTLVGGAKKAANGSALNKRRRILRRGLPYGDGGANMGEKGIVFMAVCANLFRQFEFLQQQWIQYGLDFNAGNDTCPVIGHHVKNGGAKFVIPSDPESGKPPYICNNIPPLVNTKGGEYFFIPGMTALRMIAMGIVDPT